VKAWLAEGKTVKILTARINVPSAPFHDMHAAACAIREWTKEHIGQELDVVCSKDTDMIELWDDRAVGVVPNTGEMKTEEAFEAGYEKAYDDYCGTGD
jgi:hypothetical protein